MRTSISPSVLKAYPDIDDILWDTLVYAKNADWDIRTNGLHVRVQKAHMPKDWWGWAYPEEQSRAYRKMLIHPAGRISLTVGDDVSRLEIVRLVAHELRHIGQFHRGRKLTGYLTTEWMKESEVELDCYEFEEYVVKKYAKVTCAGYKKSEYLARQGHCKS